MDPADWSPARRDYLSWMNSWRAAAKASEAARRILVRYQKRPPTELYNILEDPYELNNLAGDSAHATITARLAGELEKWMETQGDEGRATELNINSKNN